MKYPNIVLWLAYRNAERLGYDVLRRRPDPNIRYYELPDETISRYLYDIHQAKRITESGG